MKTILDCDNMQDVALSDVRYTIFSDAIMISHGFDSELQKRFEQVTGTVAVSVQRNRHPQGEIVIVTAPLDGNEYSLTAQSGRLDLAVSPQMQPGPDASLPILSGGIDILSNIVKLGKNLAATYQNVNRVALAAGRVFLVDTEEDAAILFDEMTGMKTSIKNVSEQAMRLNKKSVSNGLTINNILSIESGIFQIFNVTQGPSSLQQKSFIRVYGDFNNAPHSNLEIDRINDISDTVLGNALEFLLEPASMVS